MALRLTMTCGPYDRSQALIDGTVRPEGIALAVHVESDDQVRQARSRQGEFDIAEFYTGEYLADLADRRLGLTAIPIFVKRLFRHSYTYVNKRAGIRSPHDHHGRRVAVQNWFTTTAIWGRAILEDEYGLDLYAVRWVARTDVHKPGWQPPPGIQLEIAPPGASLHDLLASGAVDAAITTETWAPWHDNIDFSFPDYAQQERQYFQKTGHFPIMHTLVIKTAVLEADAWVAMSLFNAWEESKQRCYEWLAWQRVHQTSLWFRALWEEEQAIAGPDIYPWGFRRTWGEVDKLLEYAHRQGITPRRFQPEELFHPTTLDT